MDIVLVLVRGSHPGINLTAHAKMSASLLRSTSFVGQKSLSAGAPSVEKADVAESGGNGGESKAVCEREEHTQVEAALLLVGGHVYLELVVHDGRDVVAASIGGEEVRGEDGEVFGVVEVETPVAQWDDEVDDDDEADEDVDDGKEGADEGAEEEGGDGGPI